MNESHPHINEPPRKQVKYRCPRSTKPGSHGAECTASLAQLQLCRQNAAQVQLPSIQGGEAESEGTADGNNSCSDGTDIMGERRPTRAANPPSSTGTSPSEADDKSSSHAEGSSSRSESADSDDREHLESTPQRKERPVRVASAKETVVLPSTSPAPSPAPSTTDPIVVFAEDKCHWACGHPMTVEEVERGYCDATRCKHKFHVPCFESAAGEHMIHLDEMTAYCQTCWPKRLAQGFPAPVAAPAPAPAVSAPAPGEGEDGSEDGAPHVNQQSPEGAVQAGPRANVGPLKRAVG